MDCCEEIKKDPEVGTRRLVAEYGDRLFGVARRLGLAEHDAAELVFRTLLRAVERIESFNGKSSFYTWLYAIMMNFRRMDIRAAKADCALEFVPDVPDCEDERPDPGEAFARVVDAEILRKVVDELPQGLRDVVVFRYYEDMSMNEIAQVLSIPSGTVRFRLFRAKKILRDRFAQTFCEVDASNKLEGLS